MAKKHKGLMSNIKSKASKVVKHAKEEMNSAEKVGHAWKSALASGGKLDNTNEAFPMGKGSQGQELFKEMMIERGRIPGDARNDNSTFKELWDHYNSAPYDFEF